MARGLTSGVEGNGIKATEFPGPGPECCHVSTSPSHVCGFLLALVHILTSTPVTFISASAFWSQTHRLHQHHEAVCFLEPFPELSSRLRGQGLRILILNMRFSPSFQDGFLQPLLPNYCPPSCPGFQSLILPLATHTPSAAFQNRTIKSALKAAAAWSVPTVPIAPLPIGQHCLCSQYPPHYCP